MTATGQLVARAPEIERIDALLRAIPGGLEVLTIEGEPGIGKTAVWHEGVRRARAMGTSVLTARATAAERALTLTTLTDLFDPVGDEVLGRLPAPQRDALRTALLRTPQPAGATGRALPAAVLSLLRALALDGPLLIAVDDAQWVDPASARALSYALRRLDTEPIGVLAAVRGPAARAPAGDAARIDAAADVRRRTTVPLGPLSVAALHEIVKARTGRAIARPLMVRIAEACVGNPFFALEIAAELPPELPADGRLPLPPSLDEVLGTRLGRLPGRTREALTVCAVLAGPGPDLVDVGALEPAERAGIVVVEPGRVRFSHPLFAEAVWNRAGAAQLRRLHRRLADLVADPEQRARHLALASVTSDESVAVELDRASALARGRGAPQAAAELLELAVELTPPGAANPPVRRCVAAAQQWIDAGDLVRAQTLLERVLADGPAAPARGSALALLAQLH
ncbi:MAG: LuxR family transcriptional regulator, partial [Jatrophihabitans sp.]